MAGPDEPPRTPPSADTWAPYLDVEADPASLGTWAPDGASGPSEAPATHDPPLRRYGPGELLGRGGIATVHAARDERLGREVALKTLRRRGGRTSRQRFLREARVTAQLEHPHIVPVHDAGIRPDGTPFYTMKYVRGTALSEALARCSGLAARLALLPAFVSVCQAMAYAHSRGVIHRDLKPDNLMLGEFGEVLVVDWGLARAIDEEDLPPADDPTDPGQRPLDIDDAALTVMGQVAGTPSYMAPEQARGEATDPRTDVYALGAILYELLAGVPPHGVFDNVEAQLERARSGRFPPLRERQPDAPPELAAIAERALAARPADRYASAQELLADLDAFRAGQTVGAYAYSAHEQLLRLAQRFRAPIALGVVALLAAGIAGSIGLVNVWAERDLAQANEQRALQSEAVAAEQAERMRRDLASSLAREAHDHAAGGDATLAAAYAVGSLVLEESPEARGTLMRAFAQPHASPRWQVETPETCLSVLWVDADSVLCASATALRRLGPDGVAWAVDLDGTRVSLARHPDGERFALGASGLVDVMTLDGQRLYHFATPYQTALGFAADGTLFWTTSTAIEARHLEEGRATSINTVRSSVADLLWRDGQLYVLWMNGRLSDPMSKQTVAYVDRVMGAGALLSTGWALASSDLLLFDDDNEAPRVVALPGMTPRRMAVHDDLLAIDTVSDDLLLVDGQTGAVLNHLPSEDQHHLASTDIGPHGWLTAQGRTLAAWNVPGRSELAGALHPATVRDLWVDSGGAQVLRAHRDGSADLVDASGHRADQWRIPVKRSTQLQPGFIADQPVMISPYEVFELLPEGRIRATSHPTTPAYPRTSNGQLVYHHAIADGGASLLGVANGRVFLHTNEEVSWWRQEGAEWTEVGRRDVTQALAVDQHGTVWRWEQGGMIEGVRIEDGASSARLEGHRSRVTVALRLGERHLVTGSWDQELRVWDLETSQTLARLRGHQGRIATAQHQSSRGLLHTAAFDDHARSWDLSVLGLPATALKERLRAEWGVKPAGSAREGAP